MRVANIAHLYVVRLRARVVLVQELFAVLGIAVGVALLFASQVASASLDASVAQLTSGVIGQSQYQLKARSPAGFSETLLGEVQRLPGVRAAVPVLEQEANLIGPSGSQSVDLVATDPRFIGLTGALVRHFKNSQLTHQRAIALSASVAATVGAEPLGVVELQLGASVAHVLVGAELTAKNIGVLANSPVALTTMSYAQRLTGMQGRITRLFVQARPGDDRMVQAELARVAAGRLNVEPADYEATLFVQAATSVNQSTKTFAAICALVGFLFAYCSMLLTTDLRRGLIRELRRGGATRAETIKTLLFDALVLAAVASLLGLALGDVLSIVAFRSPPGFLAYAFPVGSQRIVTWSSVAIAVAAGAVAASAGVLTAMPDIWTRTARDTTTERRAVSWRMAVLLTGAGVCLGATTLILLAAPQSAVLGIALLILALLCLLAPALELTVAGIGRLQRLLGAGGASTLAVVELRSPNARVRSIAIGLTAAVAVFGSVTILGARSNLQNGLDRLVHQLATAATVWVVPSGNENLLATTPFRALPAASLTGLPNVATVGVYRGSFLEYRGRNIWVLAPPPTSAAPIPPSQIVAGGLALADARLRQGGWAAISKTLAGERHLRIGQSFTLPAPHPMSFQVAALTTNLGWPPGAIVLNGADYARAWESPDPSAYNITLAPHVSLAAARARIQHALGATSGLTVETGVQREQSQRAAGHQGLGRLTEIALLVLVAGVLATATVMGAMIWQRRRRFARMKVQGYERSILWRALIYESALLIGCGCLLGAVLGVYGQLLLSHALATVTGFPVVFSTNAAIAFASFTLVTFVAAACIAIPGYRAAGVAPYPWTDSQ